MRLKHMVKDKINFRNRGPNTMLTRQPVQGRANDGGLRIGEMERDGVLAHGMSYFLNESFMIRADEYYMAICNKTGCIAIYNEPKNLFLSPYADGPINFHTNPDDTMNIKNISKFGRSFSLLRIPYSFKLLIQELLVMNIQLRIITENNVEQLNNMCYSTNINKLLNSSNSLDVTVKDYINDVKKILTESEYSQYNKQSIVPNETPELPSMDKEIGESTQAIDKKFISYPPESPPYPPESPESSQPYAPYSPAYVPTSPIDIQEVKLSNDNQSPIYRPDTNSNSNSNNNVTENILGYQNNKSILEVEEPVDEKEANKGDNNTDSENSTNKDKNSENSQNQEKKVIINLDKNETINDDNSNNSKKIIL
jgi:DNA-directed RNA polymerase II subunit RPB2